MNRFPRLAVELLVVGVVAGLAAIAASPGQAPQQPAAPAPHRDAAQGTHVVRVYYFHTTQRCASCRKIEALTTAAIREGFERELGAGVLEWQLLNIDEPPNRHFVQDYALYTKSVVVVDLVDGRQERWKNLPKIWELLRDDTAFRQYVQQEVRAYLEPQS